MLKWVNVIMLKYSKSQKKKIAWKSLLHRVSQRNSELHREIPVINHGFSTSFFPYKYQRFSAKSAGDF